MYKLEVTQIESTDIGRYRHNSKGFCEKFKYPMSINNGQMITSTSAHENFVGNLIFYSLSLLVKSFEEEI